MKELLELITRVSQGHPTLNWIVLILFCSVIILIWKVLESLVPNAFLSFLTYLRSRQSQRQHAKDQEITIREFLANSLPTNYLACVPALSRYHADLALDDIYEPLLFDLISETGRQNSIGIERILSQHRCFAVIGRPGSGKTSLINLMALAYARDSVEHLFHIKESRLPLVFRFRDFSSPKPLPTLLAETLNAVGCDISTEFLEAQLEIGRCIVFLDGLDETPRRLRKTVIVPWIQNSMDRYPGNRFIISSREPEWDEGRVPRLPRVTILDLSWSQIGSLIEKWESRMPKSAGINSGFQMQEKRTLWQVLEELANPEVRELAKNPLLLTLMIILNENGVTIPIRKHEVYSTFIRVLLREWEESKNVHFSGFLDESEIQSRLSFFALLSLFLLQNRFENIDLTVPEILGECKRLQSQLCLQSERSVHELLDLVSRRTGLIVQSTKNSYSFIVRGFFEFLAAQALSTSAQCDLVLRQLTDPTWAETILHYAALVEAPEYLLKKLEECTELKDCWSLVVASVCVLENPHLTHDTKNHWVEKTLIAFASQLSNGIACTRACSMLHELASGRVERILKNRMLTHQSTDQIIAASKCIIAIDKEESLAILEEVFDELSTYQLILITRELAKSSLPKSITLLWRLLENEHIYKDAVQALSAKGNIAVPTCEQVIRQGKDNAQKLMAAVDILCLIRNPDHLPLLLDLRRTVSPPLAYSILNSVRDSFFSGRNIPDSVFEGAVDSIYCRYIKRILDIVLASVFLIGAAPVFLLSGLLVKLESSGPVLYRQDRVGWKREVFKVLKFRTMVVGAEAHGAVWAQKTDPRVTRVGKFLRITRFDELPTLLNVFAGDMSLVGPRPERPEFFRELSMQIPFYEARVLSKPGMTGLAQVEYRYGASIEDAHEKLIYDLHYMLCCSFWLDLKILGKSVLRTFMGGY